MEPIEVGDDLNEVSVLVNVAHRLLLAIRDEVEAEASLQPTLGDLDEAHDQLDRALESIGRALDQIDAVTNQSRGQRPTLH